MKTTRILGLGATLALGLTLHANAAQIGTVSGDYSVTSGDNPTITVSNTSGLNWADVTISDNQDAIVIDLGALAAGNSAAYSFNASGAFQFDPDDFGGVNASTLYTVTVTGPAGLSTPFGDAPVGNGNDWLGIVNDNSTGTSGVLAPIFAIETVPEPATLALLGTGLVGLGWIRRRSAR